MYCSIECNRCYDVDGITWYLKMDSSSWKVKLFKFSDVFKSNEYITSFISWKNPLNFFPLLTLLHKDMFSLIDFVNKTHFSKVFHIQKLINKQNVVC